MRKNYRRILCLVLVSALFLSSNVVTFAKGTEINGGEILGNLYEATTSTSEIMTPEMELEIESTMRASYLESVMKSRNQYSAYYGGCYLKQGELIVKLTNTSEDIIAYFKDVLGGTINYEKCEASLSELESIQDVIYNYLVSSGMNTDEVAKSIVSVATYVMQNKVCVAIKDCTEEKISLFKEKVIDSDHIIFETSQGCINEATYINPGQIIHLTVNGTQYSYSMGFRCKKLQSNGSYIHGFVTAAHGGVNLSSAAYAAYGSVNIGHVQSYKYNNTGTVDAAFVKITNANYSCSNTVYQNGASLIATAGTLYQGNTVKKAGHASGVSTGTIVATNSMMVDNQAGVLTKDLYEATYGSASGDSGGVVYASNRIIVGIHKGKDPARDNHTFAVKASNICSELGLTMY